MVNVPTLLAEPVLPVLIVPVIVWMDCVVSINLLCANACIVKSLSQALGLWLRMNEKTNQHPHPVLYYVQYVKLHNNVI